ncbi:NmrA-domain-containing protein [Patellaria atrata CBS 101060]|uniref:NmrA-domain-containing protein n=1 Tax=Patellaria atrata CBS 101060 TaxID=1346257 RepID=A0A9P4SGF7_9PEZI|nr:NmrA-domain-containing protein [Patellaria atrata CBS 101060]
MPGMTTSKSIVTINSCGRQAASLVRCAAALGWRVRAQMRETEGVVYEEFQSMSNVEVVVGSLEDKELVKHLFDNVRVAFINTTHWGDEVAVGRSLADAARKAGVQHYIYSSMPDHSAFGRDWKGLPLWAQKFTIENYIRQIGLPATFIYCGIYHNNFTSIPLPLFRFERQADDSFLWQAPFHPDDPLPWLNAENDVGPPLVQIIKDGPKKWGGHRIPLAFSHQTPVEVCQEFTRALGRPFRYIRGPIKYEVPVPSGYREHLEVLEETLGKKRAPYFGPELEPDCTRIAWELWEAPRSIQEYASEAFLDEEFANGQKWMQKKGDDVDTPITALENFSFGGSC